MVFKTRVNYQKYNLFLSILKWNEGLVGQKSFVVIRLSLAVISLKIYYFEIYIDFSKITELEEYQEPADLE